MLRQEPLDLAARLARARALSHSGALELAAADYERWFNSGKWGNDGAWLWYARILLLRHDMKAYRNLCARLLSQVGPDASAFLKCCAARVCGLAPGAVSKPDRVVQLAKDAVPNLFDRRAGLFALALAHYRAGQWQLAEARVRQCMTTKDALGWPLLAMIYQQRGQIHEARKWLDRGAALVAKREQNRTNPPRGNMADHEEWQDFQILYAEAQSIVGKTTP